MISDISGWNGTSGGLGSDEKWVMGAQEGWLFKGQVATLLNIRAPGHVGRQQGHPLIGSPRMLCFEVINKVCHDYFNQEKNKVLSYL